MVCYVMSCYFDPKEMTVSLFKIKFEIFYLLFKIEIFHLKLPYSELFSFPSFSFTEINNYKTETDSRIVIMVQYITLYKDECLKQ